MFELTARKAANRTCPYCRDELGETGVIFCSECKTSLHRECFDENKGCTTMGCGVRTERFPHCIQCRRRLHRANSTVCLHCGYDLRRGEYYQLDESPRMDWVLPKWMALTVKGRRKRAYVLEQQRRARGERPPFPKSAILAASIAGGLAYWSSISTNQVIDVSAMILVPIWTLATLYMLGSYIRG